jgi:hypothetical protein
MDTVLIEQQYLHVTANKEMNEWKTMPIITHFNRLKECIKLDLIIIWGVF